MAVKLSGEAFLAAVERSGLVEPNAFDRLLKQLRREAVAMDDSVALANALVARNVLTGWQADKLLEGKRKGFVLGKYRLLSLLGKGGMSSVYLAEHVLMHRRCAIKVLPTKFVHDRSYLARFHREAQAVASLDHLNIVRAYDVDKQLENETEIHFLVMEYVEGRSLHEAVLADGPLDYVTAADYIRQAAEGLAHAHESGVVHRDVKPSNLLVDRVGVVKILDLGLARFFHDKDTTSVTVAHQERMLGTADYLAPEQALDSHKAGVPADIYSLGCTFYYLLSGRPPFDHGSLARRLMNHQSQPLPALEKHRPDVPPQLAGIITHMTAKRPEQRIESAAEVARRLTDWLLDNAGEKWKLQNPSRAAERARATSTSHPPHTQKSSDAKRSGRSSKQQPPDASQSDKPPRTQSPSKNRQGAATPPGESAKPDELTDFLARLDSEHVELSDGVPSPSDSRSPSHQSRQKPTSKMKTPSERSPDGSDTSSDHSAGGRSSQRFASPGPSDDRSNKSRRRKRKVRSKKKERLAARQPERSGPAGPASGRSPAPPQPGRSTGRGADATRTSRSASRLPPALSRRRKARRKRHAASFHKAFAAVRSRISTPTKFVTVTCLASCLTAVLLYVTLLRREPDTDRPVESTASAADDRQPFEETARRAPAWVETGEIHVGPGRDFASIGAAIDGVKEHFSPLNRRDVFTIKVAGGTTYRERIALDNSDFSFPRGIAVVCDGPEPAVMAPDGPDPVLTLIGMERFSFDGFHINAEGKPVAVQLSRYLLNTKLRKLTISGFEEAGIVGDGPAGLSGSGDQVFFEQIVLKAAVPQADGMRFSETSTHRPANLRLLGCRFVGPLATGISFRGDLVDIHVRESLFVDVADALNFHGETSNLRDVTIENNSFFQVKRGVVFGELPSEASSSLAFRRNLFVDAVAEGIVLRHYNERTFLSMFASNGIAENWSNRPAPSEPFAGEVPLFGNGGHRGVTFQFESTIPTDESFLQPTADAPHRSAGAFVRQ